MGDSIFQLLISDEGAPNFDLHFVAYHLPPRYNTHATKATTSQSHYPSYPPSLKWKHTLIHGAGTPVVLRKPF